MTTPEYIGLGLYIDYRTLYGEKELRTIADRIANTINDLELDQEWDDEETVMLAFGEFMNSKYFKALITLHTQRAERLAQNKMQVDSALHVEEYHYHRLNDVKIGNASVEELITDSKRRIAHLTNPTEEGEL